MSIQPSSSSVTQIASDVEDAQSRFAEEMSVAGSEPRRQGNRSSTSRKYTVYVPGAGISSSTSIKKLRVNGSSFSQMVDSAVSEWERCEHSQWNDDQHSMHQILPPDKPRSIWLDVTSPSVSDITALAQIFDMEDSVAGHLLHGIHKLPSPGCKVADKSLYLCWAETTASADSVGRYIVRGAFEQPEINAVAGGASADGDGISRQSTHLVGGYIPVPPWLQPSATQIGKAVGFMKMETLGENENDRDAEGLGAMEAARQKHIQQLLSLLDRPRQMSKSRIQAALKRWGPGHERWQDIVSKTEQIAPAFAASAAEQVSRAARELVGYRVVQVWMRGPVVLTFHQDRSLAVDGVMSELASLGNGSGSMSPAAVEAESIVQGLIEHWVHAASSPLCTLEKFADKLDHELTQPLRSLSIEASQWTPVIARCRKIALALLRRTQANEAVLGQLCRTCRALHPESYITDSQDMMYQYRAWFSRPATRHALRTLRTSCDPPSARLVMHHNSPALSRRGASMHDVVRYGKLRRHEALWLQYSRTTDARTMYKRAEQRISRLHKMMLDRQRQRLLSTQQSIHQYFRILVTVELVFLPLELWYNLDNMNGITTPGRLQPEGSGDMDFWLTLLGSVIWAITAISLYAIYSRFFALSTDTLRTANMRRMQRHQAWLRSEQRKGVLAKLRLQR
ncbi:hypothetical protein GQ54DRAFT_76958 [Martensiomyces pterosporus]|nr:hypothetical protein GQ54DRAFT_76958 [Martensiomyces pterosporus]